MNRLQRAWLLQDNTPRTAYHPSGRPKGTSSPTPPGLPGRVLPAATNPGSAFHGSYAVSPVARHRHSQPQPSVARPPVPVTIPAAAAPASAAESSAAASGSMPQFGSGAAQRSNGSGPDLLPAAAERGMDNGSAEAGACYQQFNYDLERIWDAIEELQDEAATLRSCLMDTQILDQDFFLARLHERRCAMNPIEGTATFAQAAEFEDVMKLLLQFGDVQDMQAIGLASVSVGQSMRLVAQDLFIASLHVFGGEDGQRALNTSERFNEVTHSWEPVANMSDARAFALTNKLAGRLYVCGGTIGGESLRSAERFDPIAGTWEVLPEMQHARATALSVALGGCIYIIGGAAGEGCLSSVERYDPTAGPQGAWETMPSMREPRAAATGTAIGEHIYVCGGREGQRVLDSSERFDPASGTWVELPPRPPGRAYAVAAEIQGKLYLCGGATTAGFLNTAECFDPALGFWRDLPSMADRRASAAAAVVGPLLFVCGGRDADRHLNSVERLDTRGGSDAEPMSWVTEAPMARPRINALAMRIAGCLYICGGDDGTNVLSGAERFDLALGVWEKLPAMRYHRAGATAMVAVASVAPFRPQLSNSPARSISPAPARQTSSPSHREEHY